MQAQVNEEQTYTPLPLRAHTIFGVCEAIGEDFGFNPVFLRIPFAASVLWSPTWAIGAYFALGAVVLLSRLLFPKARASNVAIEQAASSEEQEHKLPLAA